MANFESNIDSSAGLEHESYVYDTQLSALTMLTANVTAEELETVLTTVTKLPMAHNDMLLMSDFSLGQSLDDPRVSYDLGSDVLWGIALKDKILGLLQMFTHPYVLMLPIAVNGFVAFTREQIAKEIMYHIAFHTTTTCRVRLVMADLEPAVFRHAPHPPCYNALMIKLISIWEITDIMPAFLTVSQVHQELRESAFMLLHQRGRCLLHRKAKQSYSYFFVC
ncbi:uncharacterized protein F5147DRAFT_660778 [Suillus discolor]|uniref:Uncharacterized protein n=1 Tax=Suillus discolor TaxID=1912936 RepID=A0A9P7ERA1_9AGAM|nr:uncharacterized protein F5147DRAFT_660778 [Suillus discolor]KAG2081538.1 hypothetical protein F5147DRAFT_660778 [Suillus discolor]